MRHERIIIIALLLLCLPFPVFAGDFEDQLKEPVLKKAWADLKVQKNDEAIRLLTAFTSDLQSAAQYHFILAKAYDAEGKNLDARRHYRLAYLYFPNGELKEISLINKAEAALRLRNYYEARNDFALFLRQFPESKYLVRVQSGLVVGLIGSGQLKEALQLLNRLDPDPGVLYARANVMQRLGMTREASGAYAEALAKDPSYVDRLDERTHFVSEGSASPFASLAPPADETLYYLGENYRLMSDAANAEKYLSRITEGVYKDKAEISLGLLALSGGMPDKATTLFSGVVGSSDREVRRQAQLYLAQEELRLGKTAEARARLADLRRNYPYTPEYDRALLMLSDLAAKDGNLDESLGMLKELIFRRYPVREALDQVVAILRQLAEKKQYDKLAEVWRSAGSWLLDNTREKFLVDMAEALKGTGRPQIDILQWMADNGSDANRGRAVIALAGFYADLGENAKAKEYLGKIRNKKGREDDILRIEARMLMTAKDYRGAAAKFSMIRKYMPADLDPFGYSAASSGEPARFFVRFGKAVAETGGDAESFSRLADIGYDMGRKKEAMNYYRAALAKDPGNAWCLYRLATMSAGGEAEELFKKASSGASPVGMFSAARYRELELSKKYPETAD
ncbi:MAG: tetratricopeptide repeat protein [Nitrospiraceae bacterium]|nr:tetratricopeptide repeat protein [Nitrospiraceae bacterium]